MPQVAYINRGDELRTVRIISDDGIVTDYDLFMAVPEHVQLIMDLDRDNQLRVQIEDLYIPPLIEL